MSDFTITLSAADGMTIAQKQAGIAAALAQYNAMNPDEPLASPQDYVDYVMNMAAESYVMQYAIPVT
ncbi:hypothetical protein [Paraburkholderia domus]|uniref:hypothetical protein n=1 Tax=Paraburkholderia domus TaxID=2793075 RepID=UPI0019143B3E|nr:hypothetical protein [Paraburkholderia domus]MBK5061842.1 hypothetical protein [Burkholderia sp. R-70199]CAE6901488.1 hypothetical protein R70199_03722 [Paraburkholderia domus]